LVEIIPPTPPALPVNEFGRFIGTLSPTWLDDGRKMTLNGEFAFIDPRNKAWVAPVGSEIDGASIPRALWTIVGGPYEGPYRNASVVHDVACDEKTEPSGEVHRMFYFACRCAGVGEAKAKVMYWAVLNGGPQWKTIQQASVKDGEPTYSAYPVDIEDGRALSGDEIQAALEYIEANDPDLSEIANLQIDNGVGSLPVLP